MLAKSNKGKTSRLGMVVAKKHVRSAVQRNRIKRLIREAFRNGVHITADVVILAQKGSALVENKVVCATLSKAFDDMNKTMENNSGISKE